jgi:hypothetical protein
MIKHNVNTEKFEVYQLTGKEERFVAVPIEFEKEIARLCNEYGNMRSIPHEKTVRGIFLNRKGDELILDENAQQNDISISSLRSECAAEFIHHKTL